MDQALLPDGAPQPKPPQSTGTQPQSETQPLRRTISTGSSTGFCCNRIITAKYTFYNFIPKNLFEQFHKVANLYFLSLAIMVCFPSVSPYSNIYSTIAPISLVLAFSAFKDGYADWKRHLDDRATNQSQTQVLSADGSSGARVEQVAWSDVRVGDIVRVNEDGNVPADMVLLSVGTARGDRRTQEILLETPLSTSSAGSNCAKHAHEQICHVDSSNLDGEDNLKMFRCHEETAVADTPELLQNLQLHIDIDAPNGDLYTTQGWMTVNGGEKLSLDVSQLLLRGHRVRNTGLAWGIIVYTGHDSKIMKNNERELLNKVTQVEHAMNKQLLFIFAGLFTICAAASVGSALFTRYNYESAWYLGLESADSKSYATNWYGTVNGYLVGLLSFLTFIMLFSNMVPISLYVTTEFLKLCFGQFISWDAQMVDPSSGRGAKCRNVNIPEELGQVACVLSDKTGTLTCNRMTLLRMSVAGEVFGQGFSEIEQSDAALGLRPPLPPSNRQLFDWENPTVLFWDPVVSGYRWLQHSKAVELEAMMEALALCHGAIPCDADNDGTVHYNAASPDDGALVLGAANLGMRLYSKRLLSSGKERVVLEAVELSADDSPKTVSGHDQGCKGESVDRSSPAVKHVMREYTMLQTIEFNSDRKRMSVVVQRAGGGKLLLISKGADTVMANLLADPTCPDAVSAQRHADQFAASGLRTLLVGCKELEHDKFVNWRIRYHAAKEANSEHEVAELEVELESGLTVLGTSAIEDQLQEDVAQTLEQLRAAKIRTWVLTGDKQETAIKIGQACKLLELSMNLMVLEPDAGFDRSVPVFNRRYTENDELANLTEKMREFVGEVVNGTGCEVVNQQHALVVSGPTLMLLGIGLDARAKQALTEQWQARFEEAQVQLVLLASQCAAVLCCRVSPAQKADLTKLVKTHTNEVTLAIGDGANDVGMINEAHVGVGIAGVEGSQAVNNSDFALARFKDLAPLLLVHGHWTYKRLCDTICYFFYKNVSFASTLVLYTLVTGFSGNGLYDDMAISAYNFAFTSLPVFAFGGLSQDLSYDDCKRHPEAYQAGQENAFLNTRRFFYWVTEAVYVSVVSFMVGWEHHAGNCFSDGKPIDQVPLAIIIYTTLLVTVTYRLALQTPNWTWIHHLCYWFSLSLWWAFVGFENLFPRGFVTSGSMYGAFTRVFSQGAIWLVILLSTTIAILPAYIRKATMQAHCPTFIDQLKKNKEIELETPLTADNTIESPTSDGLRRRTTLSHDDVIRTQTW